MYLERPNPRTNNLIRIILLIALIGAGVFILDRSNETAKPVTPTPAPTRTAASYIQEAEAAIQRGKFDDAITALKVALTLEPDNPAIAPPLVRLMIYQSQGRKERKTEALRLAQRAARVTPDKAPVQAALALALDWNDQTLEAIAAARTATQLDPNYAEGFAYLAEAYADGQNWPRAESVIRTALTLDPNSVDAHRVNGYVLETQGRFGEAISAYQRAVTLAPNVAYLYLVIARNYRALGNFDGAIVQYQRALELEPRRGDTQDELGYTLYLKYTTYGRQADLEQAIRALEQATEANPDYAAAWAHLGMAYYARRNYEDAIPSLQKALELGATKTDYYDVLGLSYFYMDQCEKAMPLFQRALSVDPNDASAQGGMNLCLGVTPTPLPLPRKP
jgi:tetratricopeptide (TPR) repeat protein